MNGCVDVIGGYEDIYIPIQWKPVKIGYAIADIKAGMSLVNEGKTSVNVYDNAEGTGAPMVVVLPGDPIGFVIQIEAGAGGPAYRVHSDAISASNIFSHALDNVFFFLPESGKSYGYVLFKELKDTGAITDTQIKDQKETYDAANPPTGEWIEGVPNWLTVVGGAISIFAVAGAVQSFNK